MVDFPFTFPHDRLLPDTSRSPRKAVTDFRECSNICVPPDRMWLRLGSSHTDLWWLTSSSFPTDVGVVVVVVVVLLLCVVCGVCAGLVVWEWGEGNLCSYALCGAIPSFLDCADSV